MSLQKLAILERLKVLSSYFQLYLHFESLRNAIGQEKHCSFIGGCSLKKLFGWPVTTDHHSSNKKNYQQATTDSTNNSSQLQIWKLKKEANDGTIDVTLKFVIVGLSFIFFQNACGKTLTWCFLNADRDWLGELVSACTHNCGATFQFIPIITYVNNLITMMKWTSSRGFVSICHWSRVRTITC